MTPHARTTALAALLLTTAITVSACGGSDTSAGSSMSSMPMQTSTSAAPEASAAGTPAAGAHNAADVAFATQMIPHHRQAVQMADLAATRAASPEVKALAASIKAAQAPEINQMSGWLVGWSAPVPTQTGMGDMAGMGSMDNGMMSDQDMTSMSAKTGTAFDIAFLTGMTGHHKGAVAMAQTELATGSNAEAKKLAQSIITSQSAEITQMAGLLKQAQQG